MTNKAVFPRLESVCKACGAEEVGIECYGTGHAPAEWDGKEWVAIEGPYWYDIEYGQATCADCGTTQ